MLLKEIGRKIAQVFSQEKKEVPRWAEGHGARRN